MFYIIYSIILLFFAIYSYSQIDLNLTLSSNQIYQNFQQQLIQLGYFNRPFSTAILILLLISLYITYLLILFLAKKNKLTVKNIAFLTGLTVIILFFAYSAFSHDIFNYMFDARIVTTYGENPYIHSALDYPNDLWTRFMHWTHRTYPYGPVWLILTLPFSYLGFGKFVLTLFNFKLLFTLSHVGNVFLIYKILNKMDSKLSLLGTAVYAFNPVVLIESLVSPHNEVMMLFFLLFSIYLMFVKNNKIMAFLNLLLSGGIKFVTLIVLIIIPLKKIKIIHFLILSLFFLTGALVIEIIYREPYSWYFIPVLGISALLVKHKSTNILTSGASLAAMLRYLPFIYTGEYSKSLRDTQDIIFFIMIGVTLLVAILQQFMRKPAKKPFDPGSQS